MAKKTRDPVEELVLGCFGYVVATGFVLGLIFAGIIWGIVAIVS